MSQFVETRTKTFTAGAAIAKHLRVVFSSGKLAVAPIGASGDDIGTMGQASLADGDVVPVVLRNAQGTVLAVAASAFAQGAALYGAAGGKVDDAASGAILGYAMEAAGADGDVIEVLRVN